MERQVHHLVRLVDDLLDVSRVMRGKIELRKEPVELATVVARAVETALWKTRTSYESRNAAGHAYYVRVDRASKRVAAFASVNGMSTPSLGSHDS